MALLSKIEAAIELRIGVELLEYFSKQCPKRGEDQKLRVIETDLGNMYDEGNLKQYRRYLNEPWPLSESEKRPYIPEPIRKDIKVECHFACAICGYMDNGEVAHIEPVAATLNNSPDNLIYLCPNHHTKYDHGFKPSSNLTIEEIKAAKLLKRNSRCRVLNYEANATRYLLSLIGFLKLIENKLETVPEGNIRQIHVTEMEKLLEIIPALASEAYEQARRGEVETKVEEVIAEKAPILAKFVDVATDSRTESEIRTAAKHIVSQTSDILLDIDEEECPRCDGTGLTGCVGNLCAYCGGSCFVSSEQAEAYDPDALDEVECPRCGGTGLTGHVGNLCAYCGGSCFVSSEQAEAYDPDALDEVECPRCGGTGLTGRVDNLCTYCGGSCFVSSEQAEAYDPDALDEVECPRCSGTGLTGHVGDLCALCKGRCYVSRDMFQVHIQKYGR